MTTSSSIAAPPTQSTDPVPVLSPNRVYIAHDRFVCGMTPCAGWTAVHTGRTIDGAPLVPVRGRDVIEWASYRRGELRCECGRLAVVFSIRDGLRTRVAR